MPAGKRCTLFLLFVAATVGFATTAWADASDAESASTEQIDLAPGGRVGDLTKVTAQLEVGGDLKVQGDGKVKRLPMNVEAEFAYYEKLLQLDSDSADIRRSVRHYDKAKADIQIGKGGIQPKLRDSRTLIGCQAEESEAVLFSPSGPLARDEVDLIGIVGNTLVLDQLMPEEPIAIGETWKHSTDVIGALLGVDAVAHCDAESTLLRVKDGVAQLTMAGVVHGAAEGVATEIELQASYLFHLKHRRVIAMELAVKEDRAIGHVGPGVDVSAKLRVVVKPVSTAPQLTDAKLKGVKLEASPELLLLEHLSQEDGFRFLADRRWYVTRSKPSLMVLRMVDRGELIAQCNITPRTPRSVENRKTLEEFQADVKYALGEHFGRFIKAGQATDSAGQLVYRVVAEGEVKDLPIQWRYYLLANPNTRRLALAFTVEPGLTEKLNHADREIVRTIRLLDEKPAAQVSKKE